MAKANKKSSGRKSGGKASGKNKKASFKKRLSFFLIVFIAVCAAAIIFVNQKKLNRIINNRFISGLNERIKHYYDYMSIETWDATLYFGDQNSDFLVKEFRRIKSPMSPEKRAEALLNELIKGPNARGVRTIPEQTMLRSVKIGDSGEADLDFTNAIIKFHPGGSSSELMTILSIVNTLTENIKDINKVKFFVDGRGIDTIAGHIDCSNPFYQNNNIVR
jgi:germination protein M